MTRLAVVERQRATKETTIEVRLRPGRDGAGGGGDRAAVLRPHGGPARQARRLRPDACRPPGDLEVDAHHTVEDVGILLGECLREALGDKAGVRRFASIDVPLDEALISVALDLSGRPFLVYEVDPGAGGEAYPIGSPPFDPQLAEEFWRALVTVGGDHPAPAHDLGPQHPPHPGGLFQGRGPGPSRRGARRGRRGALDQGHL